MNEPLDRAKEIESDVADAVGKLMESWGFRRQLGRVWAKLFLSEQPRSVADLADELGMSSSAVHGTLVELRQWRAVRTVRIPGERREFFVAEDSVWRLVSNVLRQRELVLIQEAAASFDAALRMLELLEPSDANRLRRERVAHLRQLAATGERIVTAVLSGAQVDFTPLREVAGGIDAALSRAARSVSQLSEIAMTVGQAARQARKRAQG